VSFDFTTVRTRGLTKMFGVTRALAGVDVELRAGEVTIIEGPNGSGKSTLLSILAQLARPTRGQVFYGDHEARKAGDALRGTVGVLAHSAMLYPDLTGRENLALFAAMYGLAKAEKRIATLAERFEIEKFMDRIVRTYSRGQLQRVSLARALLHQPRLLLLDEPSTGLDVHAVDRLAAAVKDERDRDAIVVLVTHDTDLANRVGERRIRLSRGRVATPSEEAA
jgi:heme ABC exporter ATP-binding subunit CcmA